MSGNGDIDSNNTSSCAEVYDQNYLSILIAVRCILALLSSIFIAGMIAVMIILQKYRVYTQRLILYLAFSTLSFQLVTTIDISSLTAYSQQEAALYYCAFIGFLGQVVIWWPILSTSAIVFDVFCKVVFLKKTENLEKYIVAVIILLPITISWIPFVKNAYGPTSYFCWIKDRNIEDCSQFEFGYIVRFAIFYIPIYTLTGLLFVMLITTYIFIRKKKNTFLDSKDKNKTNHKMMADEIKPLLYYPLIFLASNGCSLILTIYILLNHDAGVELIVIGIIVSVIYRLEGIFITLVFIFDPETRKKLNKEDMKTALKQICQREKTAAYPVRYDNTDSIRVFCKT